MLKDIFFKSLMMIFMDQKARDKLKSTNARISETNCQLESSDGVLNEVCQNKKTKFGDTRKNKIETKPNDSPKRRALIKHAMDVYRSKSYIIAALPKEQREKLLFMALKMFGENKKNKK